MKSFKMTVLGLFEAKDPLDPIVDIEDLCEEEIV